MQISIFDGVEPFRISNKLIAQLYGLDSMRILTDFTKQRSKKE